MEKAVFDKLVESRLELIKSTLQRKGEEYQSDYDVYHNFIQSSRFNQLLTGNINNSPEEALIGMMSKHLSSVSDMMKKRNINYDPEYIREKFGDVINYFIILETMFLKNIKVEEDCKCSNITN